MIQVHASFIGRKPSLLAPDDMRNLTSWYSHRYGRRSKLTLGLDLVWLLILVYIAPAERPNLVILLEDLESTDAAVLSTVLHTCRFVSLSLPSLYILHILTLSCSIHVQEIPIVFLIGVATSTSAIHNALPRSTTNLLETANLFVEPGIAAFNALMRGVSRYIYCVSERTESLIFLSHLAFYRLGRTFINRIQRLSAPSLQFRRRASFN